MICATRHEAANVGLLVKRIDRNLADIDLTWEIVFVDDSDDATPRAIASLAAAGYPIRLLHRPSLRPGGLSGALALGLDRTDAAICAVLDADLQHPPELLGPLLAPLLDGQVDIAVASRYVEGGSATGLDGRWRRLVSSSASRVARTLFPDVRRVGDPVSGYFAFRRDVIDGVDLRPEGFKMLVEILVRGHWERVAEVPYHFAGRMFGSSKVTARMGFQFALHMWRLWSETQGPEWLRRITPTNPGYPDVVVLTLEEGWGPPRPSYPVWNGANV